MFVFSWIKKNQKIKKERSYPRVIPTLARISFRLTRTLQNTEVFEGLFNIMFCGGFPSHTSSTKTMATRSGNARVK